MMPDDAQFVIGVDTHRDRHTLAVCDRVGMVLGTVEIDATAAGYRQALLVAEVEAPGVRVWAIEGTGSYGRGLCRRLVERGERVVEIDRPSRDRGGRSFAKDDRLDAIRAARLAISRQHTATPRERECLRALYGARQAAVGVRRDGLNQLRALVVTAPDRLRDRLRSLSADQLIRSCVQLRVAGPDRQLRLALRLTAKRVSAATNEAAKLERELNELVAGLAPQLLSEPGVGSVCAAQVLLSFSHRGRIRSEAAFANLAGVSPIPASSGLRPRHRLNRGGDRQLNSALWTIARARQKHHPATIAYTQRRRAEGKTDREIRRCLKRYLARHLWRILTNPNDTGQAAPT
jgi:transposase